MSSRGNNGGGGGGGGGELGGLKKGPWTQAEDTVLLEHVRRHGEGNWNAVRREAGLQRCGKSCRLRWANHLRPNLRKGPFSPDEERLILRLHGLIGNKWARISSHLPGRTDNEVKNYWNTRLKRRQRAGQPMYPPDVEREIALFRAHNLNPFAPAPAARAARPAPLVLQDGRNSFALPPKVPSPSSASASAHSPLINQSYPLLNQIQQQQHHHGNHHHAHHHPVLHHHGGGGFRAAAGLPPLPARAREVLHPSNQFHAAADDGGDGLSLGLLEAMLLGEENLTHHHRQTSSQYSPAPGNQDPLHGGKWDFLFDDMKAETGRTANAAVEEMPASMFVGPVSRDQWLQGTGGGSPGPSSVVTTDDEFGGLDVQRLMSSLPLSTGELNWNA
ncbi:hypothetical protein BRADI_1g32720v3 [Brachypodium distachyon]|uniref:Uncharacterized protein n=2 Tax=Brachypodium distachyon TaxID=15368 RepID=A0A0Q3H3K8_BRADI|nr:hypothetical protein BRADI_1g32720v3 [Brachypodium distachyon]